MQNCRQPWPAVLIRIIRSVFVENLGRPRSRSKSCHAMQLKLANKIRKFDYIEASPWLQQRVNNLQAFDKHLDQMQLFALFAWVCSPYHV